VRRRGGCAPFADPTLPANRAHPVWLPETGAVRLHLTSQLAGNAGDQSGLRLSELPNIEHILIDVGERQHVVLRSGTRLKQLVVTGRGAIVTPVVFGVRLCRRSDITKVAVELSGLQSLLSAKHGAAAGPGQWTARAARLRDALVALDGHRAGAKPREIAIVICGRQRVERDWPDRGLRLRVHRAVTRGEALCNGGYRELLRKGCSI
jgi:hypothetical protein